MTTEDFIRVKQAKGIKGVLDESTDMGPPGPWKPESSVNNRVNHLCIVPIFADASPKGASAKTMFYDYSRTSLRLRPSNVGKHLRCVFEWSGDLT